MADASFTSITQVERKHQLGDVRAVVSTLKLQDNYRTGGVALSAAQLGLNRLDIVITEGIATAGDGGTSGLGCRYDYTNSKLQLFESAATGLALLEKTDNEVVPTNLVVRVLALGV